MVPPFELCNRHYFMTAESFQLFNFLWDANVFSTIYPYLHYTTNFKKYLYSNYFQCPQKRIPNIQFQDIFLKFLDIHIVQFLHFYFQ